MLKHIDYMLQIDAPLLIGSHATLPGFDRVATLDINELPYIPASSIRGRVKGAIRRFLLDNADSWEEFQICNGQAGVSGGDYCIDSGLPKNPDRLCPICRIFGSPGGQNRRGFEFSGAYYGDNDEIAVTTAFDEEMERFSLIKRTRNRRDRKLRRAKKDALFFFGPAEFYADLEGRVIETNAHLRFDDVLRTWDYQLVLLGLRLTTELGSSRNRGFGRCTFCFPIHIQWESEIWTFCDQWKNEENAP